MAKRISQEEFIRRVSLLHPQYDYSKVTYRGNKERIVVICKEHGEFETLPNAMMSGKGCKLCGYERRRLTKDEFLARAAEVHDDKFTYKFKTTGDFLATRDDVIVECPVHGKFTQNVNSHINGGYGCKNCANDDAVVTMKKERFIEEAVSVHGEYYIYRNLPEVLTRMHSTKGVFSCPKHGDFRQTYRRHLSGQGCPVCANSITGAFVDIDYARRKSIEVHGDKYHYLSIDKDYRLCYVCPKHGEVSQSFYSHLRGIGCPRCSKAVSTQHNKILRWLDSIGVEYTYNDRTIIPPKEVDVFIPGAKLAIEVNGEYWHTHRNLQDKYYHYDKFKACEDAGVRLMQFWGVTEVDEKWPIVESMLKNAMGMNERKVYARKTRIVELSAPDYRKFLDANHLEGARRSKLKYGLEHEGRVVAVIGFSSKGEDGWELDRFASELGTTVVGGFSKLMTMRPEGKLTSYSYNHYSYGNLYRRHGFSLASENKATLFYWQVAKLWNRNHFMRYKSAEKLGIGPEDTRTEAELAEELEAYQVFGAGTRTWVLP